MGRVYLPLMKKHLEREISPDRLNCLQCFPPTPQGCLYLISSAFRGEPFSLSTQQTQRSHRSPASTDDTVRVFVSPTVFQEQPDVPPTQSQVQARTVPPEDYSYMSSIKRLLTNKPFILLLVSYGQTPPQLSDLPRSTRTQPGLLSENTCPMSTTSLRYSLKIQATDGNRLYRDLIRQFI